jgi:hypothetical protein
VEAVRGQLPTASASPRAWLNSPVISTCFFLSTLLLPLLFPFDLEKYLKYHYTKTREQTIILLDVFMKDAIGCGVPVTNIQRLLRELLGAG